jgi:hypothetical protein
MLNCLLAGNACRATAAVYVVSYSYAVLCTAGLPEAAVLMYGSCCKFCVAPMHAACTSVCLLVCDVGSAATQTMCAHQTAILLLVQTRVSCASKCCVSLSMCFASDAWHTGHVVR